MWVTPVLIRPVFYVGSALCVAWGSYLLWDGIEPRILGWSWILLGPLFLRVHSEILAALFMLLMVAEDADAKAQSEFTGVADRP